MRDLVVYRDVPVVIRKKVWHTTKPGGRRRRGFCRNLGDIPVASYNSETTKFEEVVNLRGNAYALRNALKYHKKVK